jgi:single-strand DNA-binding protein
MASINQLVITAQFSKVVDSESYTVEFKFPSPVSQDGAWLTEYKHSFDAVLSYESKGLLSTFKAGATYLLIGKGSNVKGVGFGMVISTAIPTSIVVNQITLTGRAGKEPECKYWEDGNITTTVSMATDLILPGSVKRTDWYEIKFNGKEGKGLGVIAGEHLRKGSQYGVSGAVVFNQAKDGRVFSRVRAASLTLLSASSLSVVPNAFDEEAA